MMSKQMILLATIVISIAIGCGRGTYDEKVEEAINEARSPAAAQPGEAGKDDEAKEGDAQEATPMAN